MYTSERIAEYTRFLRRLDPNFFCDVDEDSRDPSRGVFWVKYQLGCYPIKIAAISGFDGFASGPGAWLGALLCRMDWRWMIESAKVSFSREYDERRAMGLDRATRVAFA